MHPLASKIRPQNLQEIAGQENLLAPGKPLFEAIQYKRLFSFVLWGPPGVGKTTIARIYAKALDAEIHELSAVSAGKDDIRNIVGDYKNGAQTLKPLVLFLDEIHRFNKAQQDFLLPFVESGRLTLIGATTENPSFEIIPALLSRLQVFVLDSLSEADLQKILDRTNLQIEKPAQKFLVEYANGDARKMLTLLDNASQGKDKINLSDLQSAVQKTFLRYDKKSDEHYDTISAFIKSMRAGQADAALYYLARMIESGEDPKFIARRMIVFASEDIGLAQPTALVVANAAFEAVEQVGFPEAQINLAHAASYLASCPKSRASYSAYFEALKDVQTNGNLPIPLPLRNAPTKLMKDLKYGEGYEMYSNDSYLPEKLKDKKYLKTNRTNPK